MVRGQILGKSISFVIAENTIDRCLNAFQRGNSFANAILRKFSLMSNYILKRHFPELISKDQTSVRLPAPTPPP